MASYKDVLSQSQGWIHELARIEFRPEFESLLGNHSSFNPDQLIEESAIQFLTDMRSTMSEYARVFNSYSENGSRFQDIKIYSVAQSPADFIIYRNQLKLVCSNPAHGVIQFAFPNQFREQMIVDSQVTTTADTKAQSAAAYGVQEITATVGPFREVYWTYGEQKVTPEPIAKFFFVEFVKNSREQRRGKLSKQELLEQIKTLLNDERP